MIWSDLRGRLEAELWKDTSTKVHGIQYDSRRIGFGDIFVAMCGGAVDGNRFIPEAVAGGAAAVITDSAHSFAVIERAFPEVGAALVKHGRRALSQASSAVFAQPERQLALSAVTGTNGKTTTAYVLEQMLRSVGRSCILVGTIETHVGEEIRESSHTTPESRDLLAIFADGVRDGCTEAVIEASSHALEQERIWGLPVDVAIWTNLTQDHLDYHGTIDAYFDAKAKLFRGLGMMPPRVAVINADDPWGQRLLRMGLRSQQLTYGLEQGDFRAEGLVQHAGATEFTFKTPKGSIAMRSPLTGRVNVYNVLAASCAAMERGLTLEEVGTAVGRLRQVPGRFELVSAGDSGLTVVVDYAHTDDALRNLTELARDLVNPRGGRVITVFGCGGDRDRSKRSKMGRAAGQGSDLVVVTNDNPRSEDPSAIIDEVMAGVRETAVRCIVEQNRAGAIEIGIRAARPADIVLIAGKGHEKGQILRDCLVPFDDVAVAADILSVI